MDELIKDFLQESSENLDRLDHELVELESQPANLELLKSIFRTIHTIKGTCGFLGFPKLEALAHAGENLLSVLRSGELSLTPAIADILLEMVDAIRSILREIDTSGTEGTPEHSGLIDRLRRLQPPVAPAPPDCPKNALASPSRAESPPPPLEATARTEPAPTRAIPKQEPSIAAAPNETVVREHTSSKLPPESQDKQEGSIRVDVNLLEKQMNLVSELVLLRNRLLQIAADTNERNLNTAVRGLNYVTSELRKNVMKTRMQPINQLFDKLPRIVRDVSKEMGKPVKLETQGGDTELDKSLLEAIKDPVTHILRNSIDHGIELPDKRRQQNKPEEGVVRIRAFHEGGNFHLEIADDGAGIDSNRVKQKAVAKGLITSVQADKFSEAEILNLIFLPGLSTAEKVTNVSGRGVGMDVVKTNVERIGGQAKVQSIPGRGTTVALEIPLTLATIPALTVTSGKSVFAIPQAALVEMIAIDAENSRQFIESIDGISVFRFRGTVLPLLSLREELKLKAGPSSDIVKLVVVRAEGRQVAVLVDGIRNTEEIVIKPLDKRFKSIALYSGAAVLGDGRVALILDIPALARRAGVAATQDLRNTQTAEAHRKAKITLLLIGGSHDERLGIPLDSVQRLEEFDRTAKERLGSLDVVQYRNKILRLVSLENLLEERRRRNRPKQLLTARPATDKISAVVVRSNVYTDLALEVPTILGIVKLDAEELNPPSRPGVRGSLVVQERVTEILDLEALLSKLHAAEPIPALLVGAGPEK